jgi:hypothetical protein
MNGSANDSKLSKDGKIHGKVKKYIIKGNILTKFIITCEIFLIC